MRIRLLFIAVGLALLLGCSSGESSTSQPTEAQLPASSPVTTVDTLPSPPLPDTSELERTLIDQGLVNIATLDESFVVRMMYSTPDNFLNQDVYGEYDACYLQPAVAEKLLVAQERLRASHPELRLILFDCVRPRSVQYQMWEIVKGTPQQDYVAPPGGSGSMHNYGAAVDLGLYHVDSGLVDMGTGFDFFGPLAQPRYESRYLANGELSQPQVDHRQILRTAMRGAGFQGIMSEWWHFIAFDRAEVRRRFKVVD
jgi:D-alanyl-D-alanine dipeptidase